MDTYEIGPRDTYSVGNGTTIQVGSTVTVGGGATDPWQPVTSSPSLRSVSAETIVTNAERVTAGVGSWADGTLGLIQSGDDVFVYSCDLTGDPNEIIRSTLVGNDPLTDIQRSTITNPPSGANVLSGKVFLRNGRLFMLTHTNRAATDPGADGNVWSCVGLAVSDDFLNFDYLGDIITVEIDIDDPNVGGNTIGSFPSYTIVDGYLTVFHADQEADGTLVPLTASRILLTAFDTAITAETVPVFTKWDGDSWSSVALGGTPGPLLGLEALGIMLHSEVLYVPAIGAYLLLVANPTGENDEATEHLVASSTSPTGPFIRPSDPWDGGLGAGSYIYATTFDPANLERPWELTSSGVVHSFHLVQETFGSFDPSELRLVVYTPTLGLLDVATRDYIDTEIATRRRVFNAYVATDPDVAVDPDSPPADLPFIGAIEVSRATLVGTTVLLPRADVLGIYEITASGPFTAVATDLAWNDEINVGISALPGAGKWIVQTADTSSFFAVPPPTGGEATLSDANPADIGTDPSAGTSGEAARADHVHDVATNAANALLRLDGSATVPDILIPASIARDTEVTSAISTHAGATDPHGDRAYAAGLAWRHELDPFLPSATLGDWSVQVATGSFLNSRVNGSLQVQNDYIAWDVWLSAGTWDAQLLYTRSSTMGIAKLQFDATTIGTMDLYASGSTANVYASLTGITVATSAKYRVKILMDAKNASSGGYGCSMSRLSLRRTA